MFFMGIVGHIKIKEHHKYPVCHHSRKDFVIADGKFLYYTTSFIAIEDFSQLTWKEKMDYLRASGTQMKRCRHTDRYIGGGLPWASQLNTTSLFFSRVSTGYTMLPGCLVKTGLCRTLLSVGRHTKDDTAEHKLRLGVKCPISERQKRGWVFKGAKPHAE